MVFDRKGKMAIERERQNSPTLLFPYSLHLSEGENNSSKSGSPFYCIRGAQCNFYLPDMPVADKCVAHPHSWQQRSKACCEGSVWVLGESLPPDVSCFCPIFKGFFSWTTYMVSLFKPIWIPLRRKDVIWFQTVSPFETFFFFFFLFNTVNTIDLTWPEVNWLESAGLVHLLAA